MNPFGSLFYLPLTPFVGYYDAPGSGLQTGLIKIIFGLLKIQYPLTQYKLPMWPREVAEGQV